MHLVGDLFELNDLLSMVDVGCSFRDTCTAEGIHFKSIYRHSSIHTIITFWHVRSKPYFIQVTSGYTYGQPYTHIQVRPAEIQTPAHWNLICLSITAPQPVLSPSSILPPPLSVGALIPAKGRIRRAVQKCYYFVL